MKVKNLNEMYESPNPDQPSYTADELDRLYGPVRKMIEQGDYTSAEKELDELTADLDEFEAQNKKKRFFKCPQFIIDGQRKQLAALRSKLPAKVAVNEEIEKSIVTQFLTAMNSKVNNNEVPDNGDYISCDDEKFQVRYRYELDTYDAESFIDTMTDEVAPNVEKLVDEFIANHIDLVDIYGESVPFSVMTSWDNITRDEYENQESFDGQLILDEEILNEGPMGPAIRNFGRKVMNKIAPKSAEHREIKGHQKDDKAQHKRHAHPVLAKDFTTKGQDWLFIPNKKDAKPMNFDQWMDAYENVATDKDNEKYSEWYNACVITKDGYYVRRGSEDMQKKLLKYIPGDNDEILRMYRVEPYKHFTSKGDAEEPVIPSETPAEDPKSPEDPKDSKDAEKKTPKPKKPVGAPELDRFRRLCKLTSFRVYDKASKNELSYEDICKITPETIQNYFVNTQYGRKSSLDVWFQAAIKSKFLYKLPEYIERFYKPLLNEDALNESPKIQLDDVDIMNPSSVNFRELIKKATEKERAELAAKADSEARDRLRAKYKNVIDVASQYQEEDPEEALEVLFNILVPAEGSADTVAGEMVRAMMRIMYRSYNDGDMFFTGYGIETCAPSAMYLYNHGLDAIIDEILEKAGMIDDDKYNELLKKMAKQVVDYVVENPETITTPNNEDSREYNAEYIIDQQPKFEFEFYGSEDIVTLVDANIINSWTLKEYVEDQLRYGGRNISEFQTERPWTHYDHQITVSGLTRDDLDFIENDLFRDADSFWESLVDEYTDELEELKNEYDDDYDEDEEEGENEGQDLDEAVQNWNQSCLISDTHSSLTDVIDLAEKQGYKFIYQGTNEITSKNDLWDYYRNVDGEYGSLFECSIDDDKKIVYYGKSKASWWM